MIEVKIDKDVREYQEKTLMNLTLRQLICSGLALVISGYLFYNTIILPEYFNKAPVTSKTSISVQVNGDKAADKQSQADFKSENDNINLISWVIIFVITPIIFVGFFKYNGMTIEKFALCFAKDILMPKRRIYKPKYKVHAFMHKKGEVKLVD